MEEQRFKEATWKVLKYWANFSICVFQNLDAASTTAVTEIESKDT